jgi:hypothetical protein
MSDPSSPQYAGFVGSSAVSVSCPTYHAERRKNRAGGSVFARVAVVTQSGTQGGHDDQDGKGQGSQWNV